jgi:predicted RND superfamily exporter protein
MTLSKAQQQVVLIVLVAVIVLINGYFYLTGEKPKTAPLTYARGAVAVAPVRQGPSSRMAGTDPLNIFLERRKEKFPTVVRDIFRMENPAPKRKAPDKTVTPPVIVKTPEEIAAEAAQAAAAAARAAVEAAAQAARADLMKFQFVGYLTDKESTVFLSKEGELFIVKKGSKLIKGYKVKDTGKNYVILLDTVTGVEVQLDLPGADMSQQHEPPMQKSVQKEPEASPVNPATRRRHQAPAPAPGP